MNAAEDLGPDWQMQLYLEEQEHRAEETLRQIYKQLVLNGRLDRERFNELVYLTGVKAKFN